MRHLSCGRQRIRSQRVAFTLIELLVVIAIIAVLASMLMPAIHAVKTSAGIAACGSNLRQVVMAQIAYAGESDGWYTDLYNSTLPTYQQLVDSMWECRLNNVLELAENRWDPPFDCAVFRSIYGLDRQHLINGTGSDYSPFKVNYYMWYQFSNASGRYPYGLRASWVMRNAQTIMLGEAATQTASGTWIPYGGEAMKHPASGSVSRPDMRHNQGNNFAFFDGHVAYTHGQLLDLSPPEVSPWKGY